MYHLLLFLCEIRILCPFPETQALIRPLFPHFSSMFSGQIVVPFFSCTTCLMWDLGFNVFLFLGFNPRSVQAFSNSVLRVCLSLEATVLNLHDWIAWMGNSSFQITLLPEMWMHVHWLLFTLIALEVWSIWSLLLFFMIYCLLKSWNWTMTYLIGLFSPIVPGTYHLVCFGNSHPYSLQVFSHYWVFFFNLHFSFLWQIGLNLLYWSTDVHFLLCFPYLSFRLTSIYFLQQPFHSFTFPPLAISLFSF